LLRREEIDVQARFPELRNLAPRSSCSLSIGGGLCMIALISARGRKHDLNVAPRDAALRTGSLMVFVSFKFPQRPLALVLSLVTNP
jgi:hypothetical protein